MAGEPVRPSCPPSDLLYGLEVRPLWAQPVLEGCFDPGIWLGYIPEITGLLVRAHSDVTVFVNSNCEYVVDAVLYKYFVN
jgi:hypothetical protein